MSVDCYVEHSVRCEVHLSSRFRLWYYERVCHSILLYYQGTIDQFINSLLNLKNQSVVLTGPEIFPVRSPASIIFMLFRIGECDFCMVLSFYVLFKYLTPATLTLTLGWKCKLMTAKLSDRDPAPSVDGTASLASLNVFYKKWRKHQWIIASIWRNES